MLMHTNVKRWAARLDSIDQATENPSPRRDVVAKKVVTLSDSASYDGAANRAAELLRNGGIVVFPTETVYGVAANAANPAAMARLRKIKSRDDSRPFTIHLGHAREAEGYFLASQPLARRLSRKCWPGPLTLVCDSPGFENSPVGRKVDARSLGEIFFENTVGLRVVDHPLTAAILARAAAPVVASSANRAGAPPPIEFDASVAALSDDVDMLIDGGRLRFGSASTIARIQGDNWSILRRGAIDERTLRRKMVSEVLFVCTGNSCRSPLAEYLFRKRLAARLGVDGPALAARGCVVSSAGAFASSGGGMSAGSIAELAARGIDGSAHRSQPLTPELVARCERIYCMTPEHREQVLDLSPAAGDRVCLLDDAGISDPVGGAPADYARCAEQIDQAVARRVEEFADEDRHW